MGSKIDQGYLDWSIAAWLNSIAQGDVTFLGEVKDFDPRVN